MTWAERYGLWRSWLMYYAKPLNKYRLKQFYALFIKPQDLVFDIGAHLGNRSSAWLALGARVVAVEPQPLCIAYLRRRLSGFPDFYLLEAIVGPTIGSTSFSVSTSSPTVSTARDTDWRAGINRYSRVSATWDHEIRVQMVTLDTMIKDYGVPVFCKIDTEGFEWEVIQGLNTPVTTISLEYLAFENERIIKCLEKLSLLADYACNFSPGESQRWHFIPWLPVYDMIALLKHSPLPHRFGDIYLSLNRNATGGV